MISRPAAGRVVRDALLIGPAVEAGVAGVHVHSQGGGEAALVRFRDSAPVFPPLVVLERRAVIPELTLLPGTFHRQRGAR